MEEQFVEVVEKATGRKVQAYLSQVRSEPDIAVELFLLEPQGDGQREGERAAQVAAA